MKKRNLIIAATLIVVALAAIFIYRAMIGSPDGTTWTVSVNMPLTGPIAFPGKSFQEAAMLALDDLKKDPANKPIAFDWNDNGGSPANAATIAQRQIVSDPSIYCVGYSAETLAAVPIFSSTGRPIFADSFLPSITKDPLVYRNIISYKNEYPIFIEYARKRQAKKIAIIFLDMPEAQEEFRQLVIPEMLRSGWKESDFALFPYAVTETDFRTIAAKVAQASPDLIIINGFQTTLAPMITALRASQLVREGNVIGTFNTIDVPRLIGNQAVEGITVAVPSYILRPSQKAAEFQASYQARYGRQPIYDDFAGYDFVLIVADLAKRLPNGPTAQQLADALQKTELEGVSGRIAFDAEGDVSYPVEAAIFRSGKLVLLDRP